MEYRDLSRALSAAEHLTMAREALMTALCCLDGSGMPSVKEERDAIMDLHGLILGTETGIRIAVEEAFSKNPRLDRPRLRVGAVLRTEEDTLRTIKRRYIAYARHNSRTEHDEKCFREAVRDAIGECEGRLREAFNNHITEE